MKNTNTYYKLVKLADMFGGDADWLRIIKNNCVEDGYGCVDFDDVYEIDENELAQVDNVKCYYFIGGESYEEVFYDVEWTVMQHKVSGEYYILDSEDVCM